MELVIHPRVLEKHPELSESDIKKAWENSFYQAIRPNSPNIPEYLWLGDDDRGETVEMVGVPTESGWLVYHANTPVSHSVRNEILSRRRRS